LLDFCSSPSPSRRIIDFGNGPAAQNLLMTQSSGTATDLIVEIFDGTKARVTVQNFFEDAQGQFMHAVVTIAADGAMVAYVNGVVRRMLLTSPLALKYLSV
jgi:hypothetical protein